MNQSDKSELKSSFEIELEKIEGLNLPDAEEKVLYLRYLIRREQQEFKLIRYQYLIELLEVRIQDLKKKNRV